MKHLLFIILSLFLFINIVNANVNIQSWQTSNHIRVLFIHAPQIPMVDVAVTFKAGTAYDGRQFGLATLTNAMLSEGAGKYDVNQLAKQFDNVGAQFSNNISTERSTFYLRSLTDKQYLKKALRTFHLLLTQPTLPKKNLLRLQKELIRNLEYSKQQPSFIAQREFMKKVFAQHPYSNEQRISSKTILAVQQQQIKQFYQRYYVAKNAMLAIVGDLTRKQAHQVAKNLLGNLAIGKVASTLPPVQVNKKGNYHYSYPTKQTTLLIGETGVKRSNPDYLALKMANYIFGGGNTTSLLMQNLRQKKGLTYGVYSQFSSYTQGGLFLLSLQTRNAKAKEAFAASQQTLISYLNKGPTAAQIQTAKNFMTGAFSIANSSNSALLQDLLTIGYYHLPLDYLDTYIPQLKLLTRQKIYQAFSSTVKKGRLLSISVGG